MPIATNSVLHTFINELDKTPFDQQKQLPNPTMIDSILVDGVVEQEGKTIVFTAYLYEDLDPEIEAVNVHPCWYPTVYFYDLQ